jgi:hypothetical protein
MSLDALLRWLEATPLAATIAENDLLFPLIECVHVAAIALVVGSISIVDLRLIGLASLDRPAEAVLGEVLPLTWGAFTLAAITGLLLFASKATIYAHNALFLSKLAFLALAGLNMAIFHLLTGRKVARCKSALPPAARIAWIISLLVWGGVVTCGRWVGFTLR